jgi:glutathione synthase/RimK-type ligase-like ATP-grasp enzyme
MLAIVSAREAEALDEDLPPLRDALAARGIGQQVVHWDDPTVDWGMFDAALIRSTWDYMERLPEFLAWSERVAMQTRLLNPPEVVRWNTHKGYLLELAGHGVPIVPTRLFRPGDELELPQEGEFVVKPAVGAGARGARRFMSRTDEARSHAQELLGEGRDVLVQPYLARVDAQGETALIHFDGQYSHAIRKGPLLAPDGAATSALFAPEQISPREPGAAERALAAKVLAALPFAQTPLYARVDLLAGEDGQPVLLELELTEPSLFFDHAPGSAGRFVEALCTRLSM